MKDDAEKPSQVTDLTLRPIEGRSDDYALAMNELQPGIRHSALILTANSDIFRNREAAPVVPHMAEAIMDTAAKVAGGDLSDMSHILTAQTLSMDALFTQMVRRADANLGKYPQAAERYMRLALKAQSQCRTTVEALAKMHQPREQTVRHIHVGPEGQAVFIENLHGGLGNGRFDERALAPSAGGAPLLGHDAGGNGVPVTGGEGQEAMPHARRRKGQRGATR